jgi:hypothetical protein
VTSYRDRERLALRELALATYADSKAPRDHRLAAKARLVADDRELDVEHLDGCESSLLDMLLRRAAGDPRSPVLDAVLEVFAELAARDGAEQMTREEAERAASAAAPERPVPRIAIVETTSPVPKRASGPTPPSATDGAEAWREYALHLVTRA